MKLYIVRHAETYENRAGLSQGHLNSQLTSRGFQQAQDVSFRLKDEKLDFAYSSDLDRAVQTAEEILKFHPKVSLVKVRELREQAKGIYEGRPRAEIRSAVERLGLEWVEFRPEGGETLGDTWERVVRVYGELSAKHKNDSVLIISHGGPIACLLAYLHGDPIQKFRKYIPQENTAISVIEVDEHGVARQS